MQEVPFEKMVCDSDRGDGGVYFYEEYFEWIKRGEGNGFRIRYNAIKDIHVVMTQKRKVIITLNSGAAVNLYLYKYEELLTILYRKMGKTNDVEDYTASSSDDFLPQLERLAKFHESGALTDEEFAKAKEKLLSK